MVEVAKALEALLYEATQRLPLKERISTRKADGRFLGEDVRAQRDIPHTDYSTMDGYALRSSDLPSSGELSQKRFKVVGECRTGHATMSPGVGEAVRIFTGATIPGGADLVVMQENTSLENGSIRLLALPAKGENIRMAGEDLQKGEVGLTSGYRLNPFRLSLLATLERSEVLVSRRPRVTILCSGDELRAPGELHHGGLAESNSVSIAALARRAGADVIISDYLKDDLSQTKNALAAACAQSDVVVTVGGVSVGDHDLIRPAALSLGGRYLFEKVKMKPGKPVTALEVAGCLLLGLPGNPSSAQVTFSLFGLPLLAALQGSRATAHNFRSFLLKKPLKQRGGRFTYYRGHVEAEEVEILNNQSSGASTAIAWANAFVAIDSQVTELPAGAKVDVLLFDELII